MSGPLETERPDKGAESGLLDAGDDRMICPAAQVRPRRNQQGNSTVAELILNPIVVGCLIGLNIAVLALVAAAYVGSGRR